MRHPCAQVYQSGPGEETYTAVRTALEVGYRHVDTAAVYRNEADVGRVSVCVRLFRLRLFSFTCTCDIAHPPAPSGVMRAQQYSQKSG